MKRSREVSSLLLLPVRLNEISYTHLRSSSVPASMLFSVSLLVIITCTGFAGSSTNASKRVDAQGWPLPTGISYQPDRGSKPYLVRRMRNGKPYINDWYSNLEEATAALRLAEASVQVWSALLLCLVLLGCANLPAPPPMLNGTTFC